MSIYSEEIIRYIASDLFPICMLAGFVFFFVLALLGYVIFKALSLLNK
jgi:hypothetical protein